MKCAKERFGLKTLIKFCVLFIITMITISGCLIASYESCINDRCPALGYQSPPLLTCKEGAEMILHNELVGLLIPMTNREILETTAKQTLIPIVFTGKTDFLSRKRETDSLNGKTAAEIIKIVLERENHKYSIEEGWVKVK